MERRINAALVKISILFSQASHWMERYIYTLATLRNCTCYFGFSGLGLELLEREKFTCI